MRLPWGKVTVVLDRTDHHAVIQVQDTGIGIPQQELPRIFDRFYRVNSDRSRSTGGSGLGLAIAQAIVQAHHGSLNSNVIKYVRSPSISNGIMIV